MEQFELLKLLTQTLDTLAIPYLITGSIASSIYGEPRFTMDIDIVAVIQPAHVPALCSAFAMPEFYCSTAAVEDAVRRRFQFNILHPSSGLKVDCILATDSEFDRSRLARGVRMSVRPDVEAMFASAEDVIIKKLQYFQQGGSEKHLRDIVGMLKVQGHRLERAYLMDWIKRLGLESEWQMSEGRL